MCTYNIYTFGDNNIRLTNECINWCRELKTINLNKCTYIGDYALCENAKLESIGTLSDELTYIGREAFEKAGMVFSGVSPDNHLVEIIEIPNKKFFIAAQYHPEFLSRPQRPEGLFKAFIGAASGLPAQHFN